MDLSMYIERALCFASHIRDIFDEFQKCRITPEGTCHRWPRIIEEHYYGVIQPSVESCEGRHTGALLHVKYRWENALKTHVTFLYVSSWGTQFSSSNGIAQLVKCKCPRGKIRESAVRVETPFTTRSMCTKFLWHAGVRTGLPPLSVCKTRPWGAWKIYLWKNLIFRGTDISAPKN